MKPSWKKPELEPQILANRQRVSFRLARGHALVECVITTAAPEAHFWLEDRADDLQILGTFRNGYSRIRAIAERKLPTYPCVRLELTPDDFERP
ncbi:DUF1488 domain-containing protein [Paraburkholderia sp. BL6669N2]|uniref:DUF1488 domain-containing protein n=1 Tax=Paraburkholderia sp. BL6669N2 TaxID=1938807 RepID=UPI00216213A5|nr:DUF1488 domain-containing protein [Paraburkholderia sp. BL6669N2]